MDKRRKNRASKQKKLKQTLKVSKNYLKAKTQPQAKSSKMQSKG